MSRRAAYLLIAVVTLVVGLVWRFVCVGLPPFLYKYGGSVLWAAMIYWLAAVLAPRVRPARLGVGSRGDCHSRRAFQAGAHAGARHLPADVCGQGAAGRFFYWSDFV